MSLVSGYETCSNAGGIPTELEGQLFSTELEGQLQSIICPLTPGALYQLG